MSTEDKAEASPGESEGVLSSPLEQVDRRLTEAARKRLAGAAVSRADAPELNWRDALHRSEVLRARRVSELRADKVTQESRESIPVEAGSYHPDKVALLVFEAMQHVGAGYFASRLKYLHGMSTLVAFSEALPEPKRPAAKKKRRRQNTR